MDNFWDHIELAELVQNAAIKLQYGADSEIIIDYKLRSKGLEILSYYRSLTRDSELHSIFTDIENDLNSGYAKPRVLFENELINEL